MTRHDSIPQREHGLPDVEPFGYLLEIFVELGVAVQGVPISWQEIRAWQKVTQTPLKPWEARLLKSLSLLFVSSCRRYEDSTEIAPVDLKAQRREKKPLNFVKVSEMLKND